MAQNSTSQPPLSFTLTNQEGKSGIHIMDTPDEPNDLTLQITNNTQQPLSLTGGPPVSQSALPDDGPSTFYLYFNRLLQAADVDQITLSPPSYSKLGFNGKDSSVNIKGYSSHLFTSTLSIQFRMYPLKAKDFTVFAYLGAMFYVDQQGQPIFCSNVLSPTVKQGQKVPISSLSIQQNQYYDLTFLIELTDTFDQFRLSIYENTDLQPIFSREINPNADAEIRVMDLHDLLIGSAHADQSLAGPFKGLIENLYIGTRRRPFDQITPTDPEVLGYFPTLQRQAQTDPGTPLHIETSNLAPVMIAGNQNGTDIWQHQPFTGKYGRYLALVPQQDIILPAQTNMTLHHIHASPQAQTSYVSIDYRNIGGLADATMQAKLFVFRLPSSKLLDETHKLVQAGTQQSQQALTQAQTQLNQDITAAKNEAHTASHNVQAAQATAQAAQTLAQSAHKLAQHLVDTSPKNLGESLKELAKDDVKLATIATNQTSLLKTVSTNQQNMTNTLSQLAQINKTVTAAQNNINQAQTTVNNLLTTIDDQLLKPPILARFVKGNQVLLTAGGAAVNSASNKLTLSLTNILPADQGTLQGEAPNNPIFTLSFICGDQDGCLAPADDVSSISINIKEDYGNQWRVQAQAQGSNPSWQLLPQNTNQILGNNEQAFIEVDLQNIPAVSEGITWLKIAYADLAGYEDGYFVLPIVKVSPNEQGLTLVGKDRKNSSIYKHVDQGLKIKAHDDTQGIEFLKADNQTSQLVIKDGKVGIGGITSPGQTLSVHGRVRGANDVSESNYTEIGHDGNNGFISNGGVGRLDFWNGGGSPLVSLLKNGNLGIGTTTPQAKLAIEGGEIQITSDGRGVTFYGGGRIYKESGDGLKIKAESNQSGIEFLNADGSSQLKIANGEIDFSADDRGITFYGGARIYKKSGDGLKIKAHDNGQGIDFLAEDGVTSMVKIVSIAGDGGRIRFPCHDHNNNHWDIYPQRSDPNDIDLFFDFSGNPSTWVSGWLEPLGGWRGGSDKRLKKDIESINQALDKVVKLNPVSFRWKDAPHERKFVGFIGQEVEELFPDLVTEKRGYKGLNYDNFSVLAIAAIREQQAQITQLMEQLSQLQEEKHAIPT